MNVFHLKTLSGQEQVVVWARGKQVGYRYWFLGGHCWDGLARDLSDVANQLLGGLDISVFDENSQALLRHWEKQKTGLN